ncbi:MAG: PTS system mannose/fructose/sorbose family transporter subunit IID [Smithellaceae bacterium]|nr:PTS system mannose/fructose/sorbose family transporter subunit IID [Smithellaceae bacterium]
MKRGSLLKIFWRTFFIHAALNFRKMQNLGFTYAMAALLKERKMSDREARDLLVRHLQMFSTNPYLAAPLLGSILKMEEDRREGEDSSPIVAVKQSLMGPYAAIGDAFFWGALRPCAGICCAGLVWLDCAFAPLAFLLMYSPAHGLVRWRGFFEGYRGGKQGIESIRKMNLPGLSGRLRWLALTALGAGSPWILQAGYRDIAAGASGFAVAAAMLAAIALCWRLVNRGVSQVYLLYGVAALFMMVSTRDLWLWWK